MNVNCYRSGTGWSIAWYYNAVWMCIMGCNFILLTFGAKWFWPRLIGTWLNMAFGCCHCSGIGLLMAGVTGPFGVICGYNKSTSTYEGDFKWD